MTDPNRLAEILSKYGKAPAEPQKPLAAGGLLALIDGLSTKPVVKEAYYRGKEVNLDGYTFVACRFDNCRLTFSSSNFVFDHCIIDPSCVVMYGGQTNKVVQLFHLHQFAPDPMHAAFYPQRHEDGSISIGVPT